MPSGRNHQAMLPNLTVPVTLARYGGEMNRPLQVGNELHCPHCGCWHKMFAPYSDGTDVMLRMLFWECRGLRYFAGSIGGASRHATRHQSAVASGVSVRNGFPERLLTSDGTGRDGAHDRDGEATY
jgi:hypothetical protein